MERLPSHRDLAKRSKALALLLLGTCVVFAPTASAQATSGSSGAAPAPAAASTDPIRAEIDAICKQVSDWLAAGKFPERIDCGVLPDNIRGACLGINAQLIDSRIPARYHCPTRRIVPASPMSAAAACAQANGYLVAIGSLARLDCVGFPDYIEGACDAINDFFATNGIPARYDCGAREVVPTARCKGRPATIVGTTGDDAIVGTDGRDVIVALDGDDRVRGRGGNDLVCGGKGKDRLIGGRGKDGLFGEAGRDRLFGGRGKDRLAGGKGKDELKR